MSKPTLLFTDGACSGNPGPGGYGAVIVYAEQRVQELGGAHVHTTNNRMELLAIIDGLKAIDDDPHEVWVLTDSTYAIRGINEWIWGWKKRGWKTAEGNDVSNKDLWIELDQVVQARKKIAPIHWKYIRGHSGNPGNERCDQIGVAFSTGEKPVLYDGILENYGREILELPADMDLPKKSSSSSSSVKALAYLSYVDGQLMRHATWQECESRVKGRSGAKYKKIKSSAEEKEVLRSWGLDPDLKS